MGRIGRRFNGHMASQVHPDGLSVAPLVPGVEGEVQADVAAPELRLHDRRELPLQLGVLSLEVHRHRAAPPRLEAESQGNLLAQDGLVPVCHSHRHGAKLGGTSGQCVAVLREDLDDESAVDPPWGCSGGVVLVHGHVVDVKVVES